MKERARKVKDWMSNNPDTVFLGGVCAFYAALIAVAIKVAKDEEARQEGIRASLMNAVNEGKTILPNTDGTFWIIDR